MRTFGSVPGHSPRRAASRSRTKNSGGQNRLRQGTGTKAATLLYSIGSAAMKIWQSSSRMKPRIQFRLRITTGDDIAVGPGKIDLLEAIATTGSITAAARALGMSYRRAWLLVDTMNRCFRTPLVEAEAGGKRGGGARLTRLGRDVIERYRRIERNAAR